MKRILALLVITLASFNSVLAEEAATTTQSAEVTLIHSETSTTETTPAEAAPAAAPAEGAAPAPAADDEWESLDGDDNTPADESDDE